jgi:hypothetical protein
LKGNRYGLILIPGNIETGIMDTPMPGGTNADEVVDVVANEKGGGTCEKTPTNLPVKHRCYQMLEECGEREIHIKGELKRTSYAQQKTQPPTPPPPLISLSQYRKRTYPLNPAGHTSPLQPTPPPRPIAAPLPKWRTPLPKIMSDLEDHENQLVQNSLRERL